MSRAFQFKEFKIEQKHAAMKVGTDSVLLGSWVCLDSVKTALDIGCGTALLSLMLTQRNPDIEVVGLEIDEDALIDSELNSTNSPWKDRIELIKGDFMAFSYAKPFDLIISNPPYFTYDTASPIEKRSMARKGGEHSFYSWLLKAKDMLSYKGRIAFVLPYDQWIEMEGELINNGLYACRVCKIRPKEYKDYHRVLVELVLDSVRSKEETSMTIENEKRHDYTDEYKRLTAPFYLEPGSNSALDKN